MLRLGSDSGIAYGEVVKLLARLKQAGIRRIAFANQAPEEYARWMLNKVTTENRISGQAR